MKHAETTSNTGQLNDPANICTLKSHKGRASYQKVLDGRKQPIRGLWKRNNRFYARISIETATGHKDVKRIPLQAQTVAEAQAEMRKLLVSRVENNLPVLKRTPKFTDYKAEYLAYYDQVKDAKRPRTIEKEKGALKLWAEHLGQTRLDKINRAQINSFIAKRQGNKISGRTVNLDIIALRNVLKKAIDDGWIQRLPTENLRPLKWTPKKNRQLTTVDDINTLCVAALKNSKNGQQLADYLKVMAYCGSRRDETLRLKWQDVDFERKQITIGADGLAKNHEKRVVDFNPALESHLKEMSTRKAPDSVWLFPSPQRGDVDQPAKTFMESLKLTRTAAGLSHIAFHDCRHFFISYCVMAGIDFMTIARWVGHKDGGVLIGKVYGHLSNEHAQRQAQKLVFTPMVVPDSNEEALQSVL